METDLLRRFGRLKIIDLCGKDRAHKSIVRCVCDCGVIKIIRLGNLKSGNTISCGCFHKEDLAERNITHGLSDSSEYHIWAAMKNRCLSAGDKEYKNYGGRGITVCDRWEKSFEYFYADMGPRPSLKHSIDRRDNDGNYNPFNYRWATIKEQASNRRNVKQLMPE